MTALAFTSYDAALFRVLLSMTSVRTVLGHDTTALVERSADQVTWTTVRGGTAVPVNASALPVSDYEFDPEVPNYYRVTPDTGVYTDQITPSLNGQVVLKVLRFAFLNQAIAPSDAGDITTASQGATFPVMNRNLPVAVTLQRSSAAGDLTVATATQEDRNALRAALSTGEVVLIQVPAGAGWQLDPGYYSIGDAVETRNGVAWDRRWFTLPLTAVAAPGPDVIPATATWQTVVNGYATWNDLIAAQATWQDVLTLVGAPSDVYVS
jgi:hypothetical protein